MTSYEMVPRYAIITGISNAQNAVITFEEEHDFSIGEIISLRVSQPYGMKEVNNKQVRILAVGDDSVTVELDTLGLTPFVDAGDEQEELAMAIPSSSGIIPGLYTPTMNLEDCFDNRRV